MIGHALASVIALMGGTIYVSPTDEPIRDGVVLIEGDNIAAVGTRRSVKIPAGAQKIDCSGRTITAGFWNSHVHFFERKWGSAASIPAAELTRQLEDMFTRYGFTSVFDLSSPWENTRRIRESIESGEVQGPKIRSTGEALLSPGAMPPESILATLGLMKFPTPEVAGESEAAAATKKLLAEGVDGIKVFAQAGAVSMPESVMRAAVIEAHRAGKPVFAHSGNSAGVLAAVRAGVDVVAHTTPQGGPWDESILTAMKEHHVALIPTLKVMKYNTRHERVSMQEQWVSTTTGQLRAWAASGGTILFGTDVGYVDYDPSEEYALMAEAGMNFRQILASLTTTPAEQFGESKVAGRVAAGMRADLVVLNGDPARDLRALTAVQSTIRAGKVVYRVRD